MLCNLWTRNNDTNEVYILDDSIYNWKGSEAIGYYCKSSRTCIGKAFTGPTSCNRGERQCMLTACPVSLWGTWLPWSECSNSCSSGERKRTRMCYDQFDRTTEVENCAHSFAARPDQQTQPCNENLCQNWSPWSSLSECSKTCGNSAYRYAFRECSKLSTGLLGTAQYEACRQLTVICSLPPCPVTFATIIPFNIHKTTKLTVVTSTSQPKRINLYNWQTWLSWSACSNQCRPGNRVRVRKCLDRLVRKLIVLVTMNLYYLSWYT